MRLNNALLLSHSLEIFLEVGLGLAVAKLISFELMRFIFLVKVAFVLALWSFTLGRIGVVFAFGSFTVVLAFGSLFVAFFAFNARLGDFVSGGRNHHSTFSEVVVLF